MSYDLMVFEAQKAPNTKKEFLAWFAQKSEWEEDRDYSSLEGTSERLRNWFFRMKDQFPPLNGVYAPSDDDVDQMEEKESSLTDYCIGSDLVYASFAWSLSKKAYYWVRKEAMRSGLGFFDVSGTGDIIVPNGCLMDGCITVYDDAKNHTSANLENPSFGPIPKKNNATHLALFLRYMWEEKQAANPLMLKQYQTRKKEYRDFILEDLSGKLTSTLFSSEGNLFALNYYSSNLTEFAREYNCYPSLVDEIAQEICGDVYRGDAYLFAPYDEKRYQKMKERLEKTYQAFLQFWKKQK